MALLLATLVGCAEEVRIEAVVAPAPADADYLGCSLVRQWNVKSIRVQVVEWHTIEDTEILDEECLNMDETALVRDGWSFLQLFSERSYVVREVPTSVSTKIQLVGFPDRDCPHPLTATVCAVNGEPLSGSTHHSETVLPMSFVCRCDGSCECQSPDHATRRCPLNSQALFACLYFETFDDLGD
jgi:hypothetical protein